MNPIIFIIISTFSFLSSKYHIQPIQCAISSPPPSTLLDADGDTINLPIVRTAEKPTFPLFNPFNIDPKNQQPTGAIDPNAKKACDATDNPDLCLLALKPFLMQSHDKTDAFSLLEMQIKATQQATQLAVDMANKNPNGGASKDCKEVYGDALDNLQKALDVLPAKDIGTMNSMLSAAISDFGTCDDGFQESGAKSPMADVGSKLTKLVSNCLAMVPKQ